jgi:hypothetical protein
VALTRDDEAPPNICVECGRLWDGVERGWQRHRVDLDETALYCPNCAEREFG